MEQNEDFTKKLKKDSFYKQQQQRLQHITLNKDLSADDLIKNILEKVDTDAKITKFYNNNTQQQKIWIGTPEHQHTPNAYSSLPIPQCFFIHSNIPEIYLKIWNSVQNENSTDFCHRDRLYQILISSNLSNDILAKLWAFVNRTKPGELTKNELFIMLALIGLIQQRAANPFNELYFITTIPIPYFSGYSPNTINLEENVKKFEQDSTENLFQLINDSENEFCEFKSANVIDEIKPNVHNTDDFESNENFVAKFESIISEDFMLSSHKNYTSEKNNLDNFFDVENIETIPNVNFPICDKDENCNEDIFTDNDKYCSFKNINFEVEEFGDFHSQPIIHQRIFDNFTTKPNEPNDYFPTKQRILTAIKQVMHKTFNILTVNHDEESVIEALTSQNGITFANDLYEVFQIAHRIKSSLNNFNDFEFNHCNIILNEILSNWNSINNLLKKSSINLSEQNFSSTSPPNEENEKCVICSTINPEKSNLYYNNFRFHTSCANFWLNYVDASLPHNDYEQLSIEKSLP